MWLNSRSSMAACDWLMSALTALPSTHVRRRRKFGEVSCAECTGQWNDFELFLTVKMETRHPVEGSFGNSVDGSFSNEFLSIYNQCGVMAAWSRKTLKKCQFLRFLEKLPFTVKYSKFCSERIHRHTDRRIVSKFRAIWPTRNRQNRLTKKFRLALHLWL